MYLFLYALVAQLDRVLDSDSKGRWFESSRAYHVGTDFAPFRFFISIKNQSHAPSFLLFREKSRSVRLFVCKRTCDGSLSLSTFHRCPKAQRCFFGQFSQITVNQMDCRIFIYKI